MSMSSIIFGVLWLAFLSGVVWLVFVRTPKQQGYEAALDGLTRWDNPHDPGSVEWAEWLMGWCEGQEDMNSNHEEQ